MARFSDLPPEISRMIWKMALDTESKERFVFVGDGLRMENYPADDVSKVFVPTLIPFKYLVSPLLSVNFESRQLAKAFYNTQLKVFSPTTPDVPTALCMPAILRNRNRFNSQHIERSLHELYYLSDDVYAQGVYINIYHKIIRELWNRYESYKKYCKSCDLYYLEDGCRYVGANGYDNIRSDWTQMAKAEVKAGPSLVPANERGIVYLNLERDTLVVSPSFENWRYLVGHNQSTHPNLPMGLSYFSEIMPQHVCERVRKLARLDIWDPDDPTTGWYAIDWRGRDPLVWMVYDLPISDDHSWPDRTSDRLFFSNMWHFWYFTKVERYFNAFLTRKEARTFLETSVEAGGKLNKQLCEMKKVQDKSNRWNNIVPFDFLSTEEDSDLEEYVIVS